MKTHAIELVEEVIGELDIGLVDLVDEQDHAFFTSKRFAHGTHLDVVANVFDIAVSETCIIQPLHSVVDVEAVLCPRC